MLDTSTRGDLLVQIPQCDRARQNLGKSRIVLHQKPHLHSAMRFDCSTICAALLTSAHTSPATSSGEASSQPPASGAMVAGTRICTA